MHLGFCAMRVGQLRPVAGLLNFCRPDFLHSYLGRALHSSLETSGHGAALQGVWVSVPAGSLLGDGNLYRNPTLALQAAVHLARTHHRFARRSGIFIVEASRKIIRFNRLAIRRAALSFKEEIANG